MGSWSRGGDRRSVHGWARAAWGDETGKRGERGERRGRLAPGPCPGWWRGSSADWNPGSLAPLGHTGRWWCFLRVQDGGSGSVQTFIEHTPALGLGRGLSLRW